jgi:protoporphyrinogen oxidase
MKVIIVGGGISGPGSAVALIRHGWQAEVLGRAPAGFHRGRGGMAISVRTGETHVQHIIGKLGFTARTQIAAWAAQGGRERRAAALTTALSAPQPGAATWRRGIYVAESAVTPMPASTGASPALHMRRSVLRRLAGAGVTLEQDRERSVCVDCRMRHDRHAAGGTA